MEWIASTFGVSISLNHDALTLCISRLLTALSSSTSDQSRRPPSLITSCGNVLLSVATYVLAACARPKKIEPYRCPVISPSQHFGLNMQKQRHNEADSHLHVCGCYIHTFTIIGYFTLPDRYRSLDSICHDDSRSDRRRRKPHVRNSLFVFTYSCA